MEGDQRSQTVSEHELELAKTAKEAFDHHRYESCLSALNKLLDVRRHDARVAHNRAVAQYLLSNLTLTDEFRRSLRAVNMQFDRDAETNGMEPSISDKAVLLFNQALIHMRLHQNTKATEILEQLFKIHDALGENLSVQISLLLIEMYISTYQIGKAISRVEYLEYEIFGGPLPSYSGRGEGDVYRESDRYRPQLYLFKARLHLLHKNVKACKKELKNFMTAAGNTPCAQFLKSHMEYLRQNYHKSLKVLGSAPKSPIVTDAGECLSAFYFNNIACIHFQLGKFSLASHYFRKAVEENDAALNGFPPLDRATPLSGRPLAVLGMNCRHVLLYNLGLQQLYAGHPNAAFDSLLEVVQMYHANPRLWLRLAEACVFSYAKSHQEQMAMKQNKSETVDMVFGKGLHRKLVVTPIQPTIKKGSGELHPQSSAMPSPTLEFAAICLQNSLFLLPPMSALLGDSRGPTVLALPGPPIHGNDLIGLRCSVLACLSYVSLSLGDPVCSLTYAQQLLEMPKLPGGLRFLGQLYAAEALVHLGRNQEALHFLSPDSVSDILVTLPSSSIDQLDQSEISQTERPVARPTSAGVSGVHGFPDSVTRARAVTFFNLASVYSLRKETDKAKKALQQAYVLFADNAPPQLVLLSAYIEILSGNISAAIQIIKRHQPFHPLAEKKTNHKKYLAMRQ